MSPKHLHILQHSLGRDQYGKLPASCREEYRNRYVVGPESDGFTECQELVKLCFMVDHGPQAGMGGMHLFAVTDAGRWAMIDASPAPPRLTRSKRRYQEFLDADSGIPFREWLGIKNRRRRPLTTGNA